MLCSLCISPGTVGVDLGRYTHHSGSVPEEFSVPYEVVLLWCEGGPLALPSLSWDLHLSRGVVGRYLAATACVARAAGSVLAGVCVCRGHLGTARAGALTLGSPPLSRRPGGPWGGRLGRSCPMWGLAVRGSSSQTFTSVISSVCVSMENHDFTPAPPVLIQSHRIHSGSLPMHVSHSLFSQ